MTRCHLAYMTCAPMVVVVVMTRGINSKDEQGNNNIIAPWAYHCSTVDLVGGDTNSSPQSLTIKDARR